MTSGAAGSKRKAKPMEQQKASGRQNRRNGKEQVEQKSGGAVSEKGESAAKR